MCPHSNLALRYKQNRASYFNIWTLHCWQAWWEPYERRELVGFSRNQRVVYFTKAESLMQYYPICRRRIVVAVRDRVPRDVQHCGVMLVFVYRADYTEQILVWEASSFPASQESPAHFVHHESSLPCSQKPATCPWYESDESNPHCPISVCTFLLHGLRALPIWSLFW
jgi:hypothetical protein